MKRHPRQRRVAASRQKALASASPCFVWKLSYTATKAKNEFGRVLEQAIKGDPVVITKHDSPKAVLISMDRFNALTQGPQQSLDALTEEFDALLARMQTAEARAGMQAAFNASPDELGNAAIAAARRRG